MKTHRIISIVLGAALTASLAGCSKEAVGSAEQPADQQLVDFSLSATLTVPGGDTKVTLGGTEGLSPLWETGDQILVLDEDKKPVGPNGGLFTLTSGANSKSGTFSGKKYLGQTPTYVIYPASVYDATTKKFTLPAEQDGTRVSAFKDNAVMLGVINAGSTTFANACSVLKFSTGDYGKSGGEPAIKSVTVSAASGLAGEFTIDWTGKTIAPATDGTVSNSVTATATSESGFAKGTDIYIPIIPAESKTFEFGFTNTIDRSANLSGELTAAANKIKDLGKAGGVDFLMPIILPGEFTVGEGKTVQFSRGNLYWDGNEFLFENNQWESTPSSYDDWDPSHVSHFFWSKDKRVAYSANYEAANTQYGITPSKSDVFFTNDPSNAKMANPDFTVNGVTGKYRTLSHEEWIYLFEERDEAESKYGFATVAGVHGLIVLPDDFTDPLKNNGSGEFDPHDSGGYDFGSNIYTTGGSCEAMEAAGAVFLPAAGGRDGSGVDECGDYGYYWSSSARGSNFAFSEPFDNSDLDLGSYGSRFLGYSVRLITDCQ